jgi:hypothetical protein
MNPSATFLSCSALALLGLAGACAGIAFPDPPGGWTYLYDGNRLSVGAPGSGMTSLDGTWAHDSSDQWDGSEIGGAFSTGGFGLGNEPGGVSLLTDLTDTTFLRLQDPGDPTAYGYPDPNNRKLYFGHDLGLDMDPTSALTIMDTGVTLSFRARLPTLAKAGGPLDPLTPAGQEAKGMQPYPADGDGYLTSDSGKGNFVIRQGGSGEDSPAGAIAFSFTQSTDKTSGDPSAAPAGMAGLTFNEFNGNLPTSQVIFGQGKRTEVVAFDPTDWHEVYIVLRKDPDRFGTHEAFIFVDGQLRPTVYKLTAGTGVDGVSSSYIAIGGSATPQSWALDLDWFGYKNEQVFPPGAQLPPLIFGFVPEDGTTFSPVAGHFGFSVSALAPANALPAAGFKVTLNGQDISPQLALTGSDTARNRTATFSALQPNTVYAATVIVTDSGGLSTTNEVAFDTFTEEQVKVLEAEDYNHGGGQFVEDSAPGGYEGLAGITGVDFLDATPASLGIYRPDGVDTTLTADTPRAKFTDSLTPDYQVGGIGGGEWWNYTCNLAKAPYHLWVRYASTAPAVQEIRVDRVSSDPSQTNQALQFLGTLQASSSGSLRHFNYVQLADLQDQPIPLPLSGTNTLRLTAVGANNDLALNFFFLEPVGTPDSPTVSVWPMANAVGVAPETAVEIAIFDGSYPVSQQTVTLRVNGEEVPATVTKAGGVTSVNYSPSAGWASGQTHALHLAFNDGVARSIEWSFTTLGVVITARLDVAGKVALAWNTGILQSADTLSGPYHPVAGASSPHEVDPAEAPQKFYRVQVP